MRLRTLTTLFTVMTLTSCLEAPNNPNNRNILRTTPPATGGDAITGDISKNIRSHAFRFKGTTQYSVDGIREFVLKNSANVYPDNYRDIPNRDSHDQDAQSGRYTTRGLSIDCGLLDGDNAPNIGKRIADCKEKFKNDPDARLWNGKINGVSGEGNWELVMKKADRHIWKDVSTNIIWTDNITETTWPNASGSLVASTDAICNNDFLAADAANSNTDFFGGLTADEIKLRLPTRNDFLQADLNGARFVLDDIDKTYWTANFVKDTQEAWVIEQSEGILSKTGITSTGISVRCIGIIIK